MNNEEKFKKLDKISQDILLNLSDRFFSFTNENEKIFMTYNNDIQKILLNIFNKYSYNEMLEISKNNDISNIYKKIKDIHLIELEVEKLLDKIEKYENTIDELEEEKVELEEKIDDLDDELDEYKNTINELEESFEAYTNNENYSFKTESLYDLQKIEILKNLFNMNLWDLEKIEQQYNK